MSKVLELILFADDTNIFYSHTDASYLMEVVNLELKKITCWFYTNKLSIKGHSQPYDRADLDPSFVTFEKSLPQPEIKPCVEIHLEIGFNLVQCSVQFSIFY